MCNSTSLTLEPKLKNYVYGIIGVKIGIRYISKIYEVNRGGKMIKKEMRKGGMGRVI